MSTAFLSVDIKTDKALGSLLKLKDEMQKQMRGLTLSLNDTAFTNSIQAALKKPFKISIDAGDLKTQVSKAVADASVGAGKVQVKTELEKASSARMLQDAKTTLAALEAANDKAYGDRVKKARKAGVDEGKAQAEGEAEAVKMARASYKIKDGAASIGFSEKSTMSADEVRAKAQQVSDEKALNLEQKERNKTLLQRIDLMRREFEATKKLKEEERKASTKLDSQQGTAEMKQRAQGWKDIASAAALAEKAQRAAAARFFAEGKNLAPDNLTAKGKAQFGAQYAVSRGVSESMLPNGAAGLLQATDGLEKGIKKVGAAHHEATGKTKVHTAAMHDAHSAARGLASGMGMMWLTWGNIAPLLAGASLSHGFIQAMKAGSEFAYQLTFVKALGGETAESIGHISTAALELSKNSLFGPVELANGLRTLSQAGLSASESMKALPTVIDLATVGEMNMKDAAITLVGVMTSFNLDKTDFSKIGDVFAKAAAVSQTSVEQMTQAMKTASVVGEQYGASMGDTATALTLLAKMNITGTAAGTSLRNMLKELYSPTEKSAKLMKQLGVSAETAAGELKPFPDIIFSLKGKLEEFNKASQVKILQGMFGERGAKEAVAMLALTRTEWDALNRTISESGGFMRQVSAELEGTIKGSFKQAINTLQSSLIEAYNSTEGAAGKLAGQLKETFGSPEFKETLVGIVSGMLSITNALVAMAPALAMAAGGWIALRAAMIGASVWTSVSTAIAGATLAIKTLGATTALTNTAVGGSAGLMAAVRMLPSVMGAAGASIIATTGVLGPLAIAIGAAGVAWYLFRDRTAEAMRDSAAAVATGAESMRRNIANILRDVHDMPTSFSRKAVDVERDRIVEGQSKLLKAKEDLKKQYGITSDKQVEEFIRSSTSVNSAGETYTKEGAKYDALVAYQELKKAQKQSVQDFARINNTVESIAASRAEVSAEAAAKPNKPLRNFEELGSGGGGRAAKEAGKLESVQVNNVLKELNAVEKIYDAHYGRLTKLENAAADAGLKSRTEAENAITKLTEQQINDRLDISKQYESKIQGMLKSSANMTDAQREQLKGELDRRRLLISELEEELSLKREIAAIRSAGEDVRFNKALDKNAVDLTKDLEIRKQKIYGKAQSPVDRARSEAGLLVDNQYAQMIQDAVDARVLAEQNGDQESIRISAARLQRLDEEVQQSKAYYADQFEALTLYQQSGEYGWNQFWTKYQEEAVTAAKVVEQSLTTATKSIEDAFSEMFTTGKFDWKKMVDSMLADLGRLVAKLAVADIGNLITGRGQTSGSTLSQIFGGSSGGGGGFSLGNLFKGFGGSSSSAAASGISSLAGGFGASSASGFLTTLLAAKGAAFDHNTKAFALGGVVNTPTNFRFADGGAFRTGLMGEAGPEGILPLARDSYGRLGVRYEGREPPSQERTNNVNNTNINVSVNSTTGDPAEIRRAGAAVARSAAGALNGARRYA